MDTPDIPDAPETPEPGTLSDPVPLNPRHDGWTPERQHDFIAALAESGCVTEACRAVGMSPSSAYRLRTRPAAGAFRQSWDIALDFAIRRLTDAALSRALNGVARPVFFQGEQVGERRYYDERLTMFLLRYRDPTRYGAWLDAMEARRHPDGPGITLAFALNQLLDRAYECPFGEDEDPDRPLAEGPPRDRPLPDPADEEGLDRVPEGVRHILKEVRAGVRQWNADRDADPVASDWREKGLVLRRRDQPAPKPDGPKRQP